MSSEASRGLKITKLQSSGGLPKRNNTAFDGSNPNLMQFQGIVSDCDVSSALRGMNYSTTNSQVDNQYLYAAIFKKVREKLGKIQEKQMKVPQNKQPAGHLRTGSNTSA